MMANHRAGGRKFVVPATGDRTSTAVTKLGISALVTAGTPVTQREISANTRAQQLPTSAKSFVPSARSAHVTESRELVGAVAALQLPSFLLPRQDDSRVVEVLKLAIRRLLDDGKAVTRNNVTARAKLVQPHSGRKPGLAKSTLDRNASCREIFDVAMTYETRLALRHTGSVDAHLARQTRDQLFALLGSYGLRTERRRQVLNHAMQRLAAYGGTFDVSTLEVLEKALDLHRVARKVTVPAGLRKGGSVAAARSFSLVRRSIAHLRSTGAKPTRKTIVDGTAQFNHGVAISDSTIARNADCRRLVDAAVGHRGSARTAIAPVHVTKRALAEAVQAARSLWRETRRLSFLVNDALADLDDAIHRADAARRSRAYHDAEAEAERIIAASSAARS